MEYTYLQVRYFYKCIIQNFCKILFRIWLNLFIILIYDANQCDRKEKYIIYSFIRILTINHSEYFHSLIFDIIIKLFSCKNHKICKIYFTIFSLYTYIFTELRQMSNEFPNIVSFEAHHLFK